MIPGLAPHLLPQQCAQPACCLHAGKALCQVVLHPPEARLHSTYVADRCRLLVTTSSSASASILISMTGSSDCTWQRIPYSLGDGSQR